jgi:SAM-dependent methyltransferase
MDHRITVLPRVIDAPDGKPIRPEALDNQRLMAEILRDPSTWTPDLAAITTEVFDALSTNWVDERGGYRTAPLIDALERGSPPAHGRCLEIGSGTGVLTPHLAAVWRDLTCLDLSLGMMSHQQYTCQVQADASSLPFTDAAFSVIAIGDGPLFAAETVRVLRPDGALLWSNALGAGAPYYQPTDDILDALTEVAPDSSWSAVQSEALWGSWAVVRRAADQPHLADLGIPAAAGGGLSDPA